MHYRKTVTVIFLSLALPAAADFQTVSEAYEISLSNFSAPSSHNAAAIFRQCDECDSHRVRVTVNTQYRINDQTVTLKEFRESIFRVRNRAAETVIVLHHLESDTVEQILVTL